MVWRVEFTAASVKQLKKFDPQAAQRITQFLRNRVAVLEDPRQLGAALRGSVLGAYWKYRLGEYRIVCSIHDTALHVEVIKVGHRKEVYE